MLRFHRHWTAAKEAPFFAQPSYQPRPLRCLLGLQNHVAVWRTYLIPSSRSPLSLRFSLRSRRCFGQCCFAKQSSQAVEAPHEEETSFEHGPTESITSLCPITNLAIKDSLQAHRPSYSTSLCGRQNGIPFAEEDASKSTNLDEADNELSNADHDFAISSGFWSLRQYESNYLNTPAHDSIVHPSKKSSTKEERSRESFQELDSAVWSDFKEMWKVETRPNKIDLSYWNPVSGERNGSHSTQVIDLNATGFRADLGARKLVAQFVEKIYQHTSSTVGISDEGIRILFEDPAFATVSKDAEAVVDLLTWSWILLAPPARRFKRLLSLLERANGTVPLNIPQWLISQLLRSTCYNSQDVTKIIRFITSNIEKWTCTNDWPMVLAVRLLRHARRAHPASFSDIITCFCLLLDRRFQKDSSLDGQRIRSHWCNRLLKLLALPTSAHPFKHVRMQQDAQLLLARYMQDSEPRIPLTREGYRGLVQVQLMHKKTPSERAWTKVQADTWPPWERKHQMGVTSRPRESPGSTSRANKVLFRMMEDGYSPCAFDVAARVLGGRDSDNSPTLQVRRQPSIISHPTLWLPGPSRRDSELSPQVWAARITATRTAREAWMGFCAYENATRGAKRDETVYHALFRKLIAKTVPSSSDKGPLPGDGLENFPDPELARDRVYVPEEIPTVEELYARMISENVRPSIEFLRGLLFHERNLHRGLRYIQDAPIVSDVKAILAAPMEHSPVTVADALRKLPRRVSDAYISLMARPHVPRGEKMPQFRSGVSSKLITGPFFAGQVVRGLKPSDSTIWSYYFWALHKHVLPNETDQRRLYLVTIWKLICDVQMGRLGITAEQDAFTFSHVLSVAFLAQTWAPVVVEEAQYDPWEVAVKTFVKAMSGITCDWKKEQPGAWARYVENECKKRRPLLSTPTVDAIQDFALLMVAAQRGRMIDDIIDLLRWAVHHQQEISTVSSTTKRNLAAFRVYLEGQWVTDDEELADSGIQVMAADQVQMEKAKALCDRLGGWARDEDVKEYLESSRPMLARIRHKLKTQRQGRCAGEIYLREGARGFGNADLAERTIIYRREGKT